MTLLGTIIGFIKARKLICKSTIFLYAYTSNFENIMRDNILFIESTQETK